MRRILEDPIPHYSDRCVDTAPVRGVVATQGEQLHGGPQHRVSVLAPTRVEQVQDVEDVRTDLQRLSVPQPH